MTYVSNHLADVAIRDAQRQKDADALARFFAEGKQIQEVQGFTPKPLHSFRQGVEASWKDNEPHLKEAPAKQVIKREPERRKWEGSAHYLRLFLSAGGSYKRLVELTGLSGKMLRCNLMGETNRTLVYNIVKIEAAINSMVAEKQNAKN